MPVRILSVCCPYSVNPYKQIGQLPNLKPCGWRELSTIRGTIINISSGWRSFYGSPYTIPHAYISHTSKIVTLR